MKILKKWKKQRKINQEIKFFGPAKSFQINKVSLDPKELENEPSVEICHTEIIAPSADLENAQSGLDNLLLSPSIREQVLNNLLQPQHRSLFKVHSPTIIVHIFPHGGTRHFILTESGTLLEENAFWLKRFNFIEKNATGYSLNAFFKEEHLIKSDRSFAWCPDTPNFSHFLVDSLAPLAFFQKKSPELNTLPLPQFAPSISWQDEYLQHFGEKCYFLRDSQSEKPTSFIIFKPKSLVLPVISCTMNRSLAIRDFIRDKWNAPSADNSVKRIPIFLWRNDERSARIRNAQEIQEMVMRLGGFTVDPSKLNAHQKLQLFNLPGIFIGESSGTTNVSIFANPNARLIALGDPLAWKNLSFIQGGWPYFHLMSSRLDIVIGQQTKKLKNSPIASNIFDCQTIEKIILKWTNNF